MNDAAPAPDFPPRTSGEWNDAHERVESYLRAHRIVQPLALRELTQTIVTAAWRQAARFPGAAPVSLAMREADRCITDWFARVLTQSPLPARRLGVRGRLALALADTPGRWPEAFLAPVPPPPEMTAAMRAAFLRPGPAPQLFKMASREIPLGLPAWILALFWQTVNRSRLLRFATKLLLVLALAALGLLAFR